MEIKDLPSTFAFVHKVETTLPDLGKYVENVPNELVEKAAKEGFKIIGPQFWNYIGMDGNPETKFQLEICLPVEDSSSLLSDRTEQIKGFHCATAIIKGQWSNLKEGYEKLIAEMAGKNMYPGNLCREVYHVVDFDNPDNCITEIQLGIN